MIPGVRAVAIATGLSTAGVLPVFLLGGISVFIRDEVSLDGGRLGALVALFFLASAVSSIPGGRYADRTSVRGAVTVASACSASALLVGGTIPGGFGLWAGVMVVAGLGNGISQPTSSLVIARAVERRRQGMAFGVKQAAIPFATLIVGAVVAVVAVRIGWQASFALASVLPIAVAVAMPARFPSGRPRPPGSGFREGDAGLVPMVWLATATGVGAAYGTFLASFFVTFVVDSGLTAAFAGRVLTVASIAGILSRLLLGVVADRMIRGQLRLVGRLALVGSFGFAGFVAIGVSGSPEAVAGTSVRSLLVVSALIAFTAGWSWTPLFNFAVVQLNPNAPGAASAITQVGVFIGGVLGPALFGAVVSRWSFALAWALAVALSVFCWTAIRISLATLVRSGAGEGTPRNW